MKVTLITANDIRHNYLINLLAKNFEQIFVIQESFIDLDKKSQKVDAKENLVVDYFRKVSKAQHVIFGHENFSTYSNNVEILKIRSGKINNISLIDFSKFLNSDIYIVFGSSYLKGDLIKFLIKNNAINIHMGISPFYRGSDCNFWALYDNNPHLVGATIHFISEGLDNGSILYHALSNLKNDSFIYSMSTVKSAFLSIVERIKSKLIFEMKSVKQDKSKEIRYTKKLDFNKEVISEYFSKKIDLNKKKFDETLFKDPFYLDQ